MRERFDSEIREEQKRRYAEAREKFIEFAEAFQSRDVAAEIRERAIFMKTHGQRDELEEIRNWLDRELAA